MVALGSMMIIWYRIFLCGDIVSATEGASFVGGSITLC